MPSDNFIWAAMCFVLPIGARVALAAYPSKALRLLLLAWKPTRDG
jgi:hypothetical protein